ncbi:hypothetical protein CROQUDRAFT_231537 [Cronartium quercuum f. sp. fusiforme G11]|uniref:Uncharacterized protein n=1 Tax=Cronartium quercuum f. sp. fusiforme G11 TaxID=708437 RepID=A0A9P6TFS1_9BASI|nr:hypothetical protein CROQUDRAFT_231537 [Cronartium quercuum f. sp. fusiforme G11]
MISDTDTMSRSNFDPSGDLINNDDRVSDSRVPPARLASHLLGSSDADKHERSFDLELAIAGFASFQAPLDDAKSRQLASYGTVITQFLGKAKETIADRRMWITMSKSMQARLVSLLEKILNTDFIRSLFALRLHIRNLAFGLDSANVPGIATLADVVIASVVDYINGDALSQQPSIAHHNSRISWTHQTIELVVRMPTDLDNLSSFVAISDPENHMLSHEIKLACISILYCLCCLDDWKPPQTAQAFDQLITFISFLDDSRELSSMTIVQILCLYGKLRRSQLRDDQTFRPATIRKLWTLMTTLFPNPDLNISGHELSAAQNVLFEDGNDIIAWVWSHAEFCSQLDNGWVNCFTTAWILAQYTPESLQAPGGARNPSEFILTIADELPIARKNKAVINSLTSQDGLGLYIFLSVYFGVVAPTGLSAANWDHVWRSIYSILFRIYRDLGKTDSPLHLKSNFRLAQLVHEALQHLFSHILNLPQKAYFICHSIRIPSKLFTICIRNPTMDLHKLLDGTLAAIERSMEAADFQEQNPTAEAKDFLSFLGHWAENDFDEKFVNPRGFVTSLLQLISSPFRISDETKFIATKLLINIESSAGCDWEFSRRDLHLVSEVLLDVNKLFDNNLSSTRCRRTYRKICPNLRPSLPTS